MIDLNPQRRPNASEMLSSSVFPKYFVDLHVFLSSFQLTRSWKDKLTLAMESISKLLAIPDEVRNTFLWYYWLLWQCGSENKTIINSITCHWTSVGFWIGIAFSSPVLCRKYTSWNPQRRAKFIRPNWRQTWTVQVTEILASTDRKALSCTCARDGIDGI